MAGFTASIAVLREKSLGIRNNVEHLRSVQEKSSVPDVGDVADEADRKEIVRRWWAAHADRANALEASDQLLADYEGAIAVLEAAAGLREASGD